MTAAKKAATTARYMGRVEGARDYERLNPFPGRILIFLAIHALPPAGSAEARHHGFPSLILSGRVHCLKDLAAEWVDGLSLNPARDDDKVGVPIPLDDVGSGAAEDNAVRWRRRQRLPPGVKVPVGQSVGGIGLAGSPRHGDPLLRHNLSPGPSAVLEEEVAETGHVPGVNEHAAAIVTAARHGLHAPSVNLHP